MTDNTTRPVQQAYRVDCVEADNGMTLEIHTPLIEGGLPASIMAPPRYVGLGAVPVPTPEGMMRQEFRFIIEGAGDLAHAFELFPEAAMKGAREVMQQMRKQSLGQIGDAERMNFGKGAS